MTKLIEFKLWITLKIKRDRFSLQDIDIGNEPTQKPLDIDPLLNF